MAINQKMIAEKAKVSRKTVSLYFQGKGRISDATRTRLEDIVAQYGYLPNDAARSVRTKRFYRVTCLIVYNSFYPYQGMPGPNFLSYINGAADELSKNGYSLDIKTFRVSSDEACMLDSPEIFKSLSSDGVLGFSGGWVPPELDSHLDQLGIPVVWVNRKTPGLNRPMINFNEQPGISQLVDYLIETGKKRIAYFGPNFENPNCHHSTRERYEIAKSELEKRGVSLYKTISGSKGHTNCPAAMKLFSESPAPDAVICNNYGFKAICEQAGVHFNLRPGFDFETFHFASCWEFDPSAQDYKTFVMIPEVEIGKCGAKYLFDLIQKKKPKIPELLETSLHIGIPFEKNK